MRAVVTFIVLVLWGTIALAADVQRTLSLSGLTCVACSAAVTKALLTTRELQTTIFAYPTGASDIGYML